MDNRQKVPPTSGKVSVQILNAASDLAENLSQSADILGFRRAENALYSDLQAMQMLKDLSKMQQKVRDQQYNGSLVQADLATLRSLQVSVAENQAIQTYLASQEAAKAFLREVNQEISQLMGIDFASLTRRSSSC